MNMGERITEARKAKGMSQTDLADAMGVSRQSVSKWELNESTPEVEKLPCLAGILGVSLDWLLMGKEEKTKTKNSAASDNNRKHPDWFEKLPEFLLTGVKRYGWIYGVYTIIGGVVFMAFSAVPYYFWYLFLTETEIIQKVYVEEINKTLLIDPYTHEVIHLLNLPGIGTSVSRIIAVIGLVIVLIGLVEVLILKKWGTKETKSE